MLRTPLLHRTLLVFIASLPPASAEEGQGAAARPAQVTLHAPDGSTKPMRLAHGEWFSAGGGQGGRGVTDVYRGGVELRYTWEGRRLFVRVDDQPRRLAGVEANQEFGQDELREAIANGVSPLTLYWRSKDLRQVPPVPEAIEVALQPNFSDEPFDFARLAARIPCLTALYFSVSREAAGPQTLDSLSKLTRLGSLAIHWINAEMPTLEPLAKMKHLRVLSVQLSMRNVGWFAVPDLAPLAALPIEVLSIHGQVTDAHIQAASRIKSLVSLKCFGVVNLANPACLGEMHELRQLELSGGRGINDLSPLRDLTKLEALRLSGFQGTRDLSPLAGLASLQELHLMGAFQTTDLSPLGQLPSLRRLGLMGFSGVTNVAPLGKLAELTHLNLYVFPRVRDLTPLIQLQKLASLNLGGCDSLSDLKFLAELPDLRELELWSADAVADLSPLARARELRRLTLQAMKNVSDLSPLAQLSRLEALRLSRCQQVADLGPLAELKRLDTLFIGQCNRVEDLSPLGRLAALRRINFYMCPNVADISPLRHCTRLEEINVATCEKVTDVTPLRAAVRRGAVVHVPPKLQAQLDKIKDATDF